MKQDQRFAVFADGEEGPKWRFFARDLETAKLKAQRLARDEGVEFLFSVWVTRARWRGSFPSVRRGTLEPRARPLALWFRLPAGVSSSGTPDLAGSFAPTPASMPSRCFCVSLFRFFHDFRFGQSAVVSPRESVTGYAERGVGGWRECPRHFGVVLEAEDEEFKAFPFGEFPRSLLGASQVIKEPPPQRALFVLHE